MLSITSLVEVRRPGTASSLTTPHLCSLDCLSTHLPSQMATLLSASLLGTRKIFQKHNHGSSAHLSMKGGKNHGTAIIRISALGGGTYNFISTNSLVSYSKSAHFYYQHLPWPVYGT